MKIKIAVLVSAITLALAGGDFSSTGTLVVGPGSGWSEGGSLRRYMRERDRNDRVEIRGNCLSACVLLMGANDVCIEPDVLVGFHPVSLFLVKVADRHTHRLFADELNKVGNGTLGDWYFHNEEIQKLPTVGKYVLLSGKTLIDTFGVKKC